MTSKEYILKASNVRIQEVKAALIQDLNERIGVREDFEVKIEPIDFRSIPALKAYWMMIDRVVKWDEDDNGFKKSVWHEWFIREAALTEEIDMMKIWRMKCKPHPLQIDGRQYVYFDPKLCKFIVLGQLGHRYFNKARSISNKGDVTKEEMSRLLMTVIKFGAENDIPDCFIKDTELENMLKGYHEK